MTPSARLQATLDLLSEIRTVSQPADAIVSRYLRSRRYIGSKDRGAVATSFYEMLRHHARLSWWLAKMKAEDTPRTQLLAYMMLRERKPAGEAAALFSGGKFGPAAPSEAEMALLTSLKGHTINHPSMPDDVRCECPPWAADALRQKFGARFEAELTAMLHAAPLDIRVNTLKATREEILRELKAAHIKAEACALSPWGIRIAERPALTALPMLKDGRIEIQDEGSQMIALVADARPGQRVVDFCAGAGGKTLAMAAQMNNKGRMTACDVMAKRLERSAVRFRRAGVHNIEIKPLSSERDAWVKRHKDSFDRVLVDAPCSGVGTWRRNPDQRWRSLGPGLENLVELQARILESAARLVKPGGRLIYATCSLLPVENEGQIERFIATQQSFRLLPADQILDAIVGETGGQTGGPKGESPFKDGYLSVTPAQHSTDGFFAAVLERAP